MPEKRVRTFTDVASLHAAAAGQFAVAAEAAVAARGRFLVALSGGSTPEGVYSLLSEARFSKRVPWSKIHLFWGDERLVPPDQFGSNFGQVKRLLLAHLPLPEENAHRAKGELGREESVADYKRQLRRFADPGMEWPSFDLVFLGLGNDGHTASLFPGPISDLERDEPVIAVDAEYEGRPAGRITLTPLIFNLSRHILFLVTGRGKAEAVAGTLQGPYQPEKWPAQRIGGKGCEITWFLDQAAAALLTTKLA